MPRLQNKETPPGQQQAKASVQPSRGFLSRIFGSEEMSPEMQQGVDIARREMPGMAPVEPYGLFSRLLNPNAMGYASPGRTIYMNQAANVGQSPQDIADTLTHEQTHINQMKNSGYGPTMQFLRDMFSGPSEPYHQRESEIGAFQAEKNRRARMGREQMPTPAFDTGQFNSPRDVYLPPEPSFIRR